MDNDSKNTSKLIQNFVYDYMSNFIGWPSRVPDLNPIENVWKLLKQKVGKSFQPDSLERILELWSYGLFSLPTLKFTNLAYTRTILQNLMNFFSGFCFF